MRPGDELQDERPLRFIDSINFCGSLTLPMDVVASSVGIISLATVCDAKLCFFD